MCRSFRAGVVSKKRSGGALSPVFVMRMLKKLLPLCLCAALVTVSCSNSSSSSSSSSGSGSGSGTPATANEVYTSLSKYSKIWIYEGEFTLTNGTKVKRAYRLGIRAGTAQYSLVRCVASEGSESWNVLEANLLNAGEGAGVSYIDTDGDGSPDMTCKTDENKSYIEFEAADAKKFLGESHTTSSDPAVTFPGINVTGTVRFNRVY